MRRHLARLFVGVKKTNFRRCRLNLFAALATYANGNGDGVIGGELGDFSNAFISPQPRAQGDSNRPPHLPRSG